MQIAQRRHIFLYFAIASFLVASGIAAVGLVSHDSVLENEYVALAILGVACAAPPVLALVRRRFDLFEPINAFVLSTFIYFVFIPVVLLTQNAFTLFGVDYSAAVEQVTLLALLALFGFGMGYYWRGTRSATDVLVKELDIQGSEQRRRMLRWSSVILMGFLVLVALWIVVARIPLSTLWIFGEASYSDAWNLALGPQIGYLYGAREALPACLLLLIAYRSTRRWSIATILLVILVGVFFAGSGARFRVLILVLSVVIFYFLERGKRPRLWQSVIAAFVVFYFIIGGIGFYRGYSVEAGRLRGRAIGQDAFALTDAWDVMVDGSQIATSTALLVQAVPERHPYFLGTSFLNFFTQPIPRFLWPNKPTTIGQEFFNSLWAPGTTVPFWAIFYLNFGPLGIVPGMMFWGWISRAIYDTWRLNPTSALAQVQLAVYWPFLIHMYGRGGDNFAFNVYGLIFVLAPVWIITVVSRVQSRRAARALPIAGVSAQIERHDRSESA